ncbi:MAG TPA: glycosyltransferase family 2 protein [Mycobacteriales bacterium]|nr:glycosyltransferase family 2 protein [Mycobacteriales bacterium]
MAGPPDVTVVVVTYRGAEHLPACLDALAAQQSHHSWTTWVVDNASADGTADLLHTRFPDLHVIRSDRNRGFAGGNNLALREVRTPYVVLLNDDAVVQPGWLDALIDVLATSGNERVAAVTGKVLLDDGVTINSAGGVVDTRGYGADRGYLEPDTGQYDRPAEVFAASGTALALRTAALDDVGHFDEDFFLYYEDVDLCWRLRSRGWSIRYEPSAVVHHALSATSGGEASELFHFHDLRNRLVCLGKNASTRRWLSEFARYPLTSLSLKRAALRERRYADIPRILRRRGRAMASHLRLLPSTIRKRRAIASRAAVSRTDLERWLVPYNHSQQGSAPDDGVSRCRGT